LGTKKKYSTRTGNNAESSKETNGERERERERKRKRKKSKTKRKNRKYTK